MGISPIEKKNEAGRAEEYLGAEWGWVRTWHNFTLEWAERKASACRPGGLTEVLYLAVMMKESKLTNFQQRHIMDTMKSKRQCLELSQAQGFWKTFLMLLPVKGLGTSFKKTKKLHSISDPCSWGTVSSPDISPGTTYMSTQPCTSPPWLQTSTCTVPPSSLHSWHPGLLAVGQTLQAHRHLQAFLH